MPKTLLGKNAIDIGNPVPYHVSPFAWKGMVSVMWGSKCKDWHSVGGTGWLLHVPPAATSPLSEEPAARNQPICVAS